MSKSQCRQRFSKGFSNPSFQTNSYVGIHTSYVVAIEDKQSNSTNNRSMESKQLNESIVHTHGIPHNNTMTSCRRSSLSDTIPTNTKRHIVLPLISTIQNQNNSNHQNTYDSPHSISSNNTVGIKPSFMDMIDPVAISVAANAARNRDDIHFTDVTGTRTPQQSSKQTAITSSSPSSCNNNKNKNNNNDLHFINRRGSLDVHVEYAVAMVNIIDPIYDMDDRFMCPFGTRRDSVCGGSSHYTDNNNNPTSNSNPSSPRSRRRNLKQQQKQPIKTYDDECDDDIHNKNANHESDLSNNNNTNVDEQQQPPQQIQEIAAPPLLLVNDNDD